MGLLLFLGFTAKSQLIEVGLQSNPDICKYLKTHPEKRYSKAVLDTLELPFIEDFSDSYIFPDENKWTNSMVYINDRYCINPPSIGVATFDIIDHTGSILPNAGAAHFIADTLSSQPINLEYYTFNNPATYSSDDLFYFHSLSGLYYPADSLYYSDGASFINALTVPYTYNAGDDIIYYYNTVLDQYIDVSDSLYYYDGFITDYVYIEQIIVNEYTPADSVYMSFFYQPKGLSFDGPEYKDSLVLQFYSPYFLQWRSVWRSPGGFEVDSFLQVLIPVTDTIYLHNGFRFRFYNYASLYSVSDAHEGGNQDQWNLDYIKINRDRSWRDSLLMDVAIQSTPPSLIKSYTSMPWKHFIIDRPAEMSDSILITYYVNDTVGKLITRNYSWSDMLGTYETVDFTPLTDNADPGQNIFQSWLENMNFNTDYIDSALFKVQVFLKTDSTDYKVNDTVNFYQKFYNYYAHDDETAESAMYLGIEGASNAKLAVQFDNCKQDTLRGVKIYFPQTRENEHENRYFYLTVWDDNAGVPGDTLYSRNHYKVELTDEENEYTYYKLDSLIILPEGTFYVGLITITEAYPILLGFDRNTSSMDKVFFKFSGDWQQSNDTGSFMIEPIFGSDFPISVEEVLPENIEDFSFYPNPASEMITLDEELIGNNISFINYTGQIVLNEKITSAEFDISALKTGMYFIRIEGKNKNYKVKKLIVN